MNANAFSQKDYENKTAFRPKKTNPKQTQFKPNFKGKKMLLRLTMIGDYFSVFSVFSVAAIIYSAGLGSFFAAIRSIVRSRQLFIILFCRIQNVFQISAKKCVLSNFFS